jgi:hypothetical protein
MLAIRLGLTHFDSYYNNNNAGQSATGTRAQIPPA